MADIRGGITGVQAQAEASTAAYTIQSSFLFTAMFDARCRDLMIVDTLLHYELRNLEHRLSSRVHVSKIWSPESQPATFTTDDILLTGEAAYKHGNTILDCYRKCYTGHGSPPASHREIRFGGFRDITRRTEGLGTKQPIHSQRIPKVQKRELRNQKKITPDCKRSEAV